MPRGKPRGRRETGDVVKWQIIELWQAGVKNKSEIARRLRLSWTAVNLWVQRWESEGHLNVRPRPGRPRSTSGDDETTVNTHMAFYGVGVKHMPPVKLERAGSVARVMPENCREPHKEVVTKHNADTDGYMCQQMEDEAKRTDFTATPPTAGPPPLLVTDTLPHTE